MKLPITAIIMTLNEERNLPACLNSIFEYVDDIVLVDSGSCDETVNIAKKFTKKIYVNRFKNYSSQYNWALENADISNEWVLRIDADERWTHEGFCELRRYIEEDEVDGVYVKMRIYFMGKFIRFGGFYPNYFLRVYKRSKGSMENRWMDEHIRVDGKKAYSGIDVFEMNYDRQENISLWIDKHNKYSTREAVELILQNNMSVKIDTIGGFLGKTERKRWLKENIYSKMPLFFRPLAYYLYRYFFRFGFLDGREGFIFHFLHAFWYRFLVDIKVWQIVGLSRQRGCSLEQVMLDDYGVEV